MRILVFLHGTTIMHKTAISHTREEIVEQVLKNEKSVLDFASYVPIGNVVKKLQTWKKQGAEIVYLSSHNNKSDVEKDKIVLNKYKFPKGKVFYCKKGEDWQKSIIEAKPDIIIEDDCESIGGKSEMIYPSLKPELKAKIKSIVLKEFSGLGKLPDKISELVEY